MRWVIELPDRRASGLGGAKPKGCVVLEPGSSQEERFKVPAVVARRLKQKDNAGELHAASRSELLWQIMDQSRACASQRVERLINAREYSAKEVADKLRRDGYWSQVVEDVVERAVAGGLISDRRFADSFVRWKLSAGWGLGRIERELARSGVDPAEALPGWPEGYVDPADEGERAYQIALRRRLTGKNDFQKLVRFLCARGFSTRVAMDAARRVLDEDEED